MPASAGNAESLLDPGPVAIARPREQAYPIYKQLLFIVLCTLWLVPGLVGRSPWKPVETQTVQVVEESYATDWKGSAPTLLNEPYAATPLYLQIAGLARRALAGPSLTRHDAMRLPNILWVGLALLGVGLATGIGRANNRFGWRAVLLLVGCIGLLLQARMLNPDVALLTSSAWLCLGLTIMPKIPRLGATVVALAAGLGFWAAGPAVLVQALLALLALRMFMSKPRRRRISSYMVAAAAGMLLIAAPGLSGIAQYIGDTAGNQSVLFGLGQGVLQLVRVGLWVAWPAWLLMLLVAVAMRKRLQADAAGASASALLIAGCFAFIVATPHSETSIFMILPPAAVIAAFGFREISQEVVKGLEWFAVFAIGLVFIGGSWVFLLALNGGWPEFMNAWLADYGIVKREPESMLLVAVAAIASLGYVFLLSGGRSSFDRLTINWSCGLVLAWVVMSLLWLPKIDQVRDYMPLVSSFSAHLPVADTECVARPAGMPHDSIVQLAYFTGRDFPPLGSEQAASCKWLIAPPHNTEDLAVAVASRLQRQDELGLYRIVQ